MRYGFGVWETKQKLAKQKTRVGAHQLTNKITPSLELFCWWSISDSNRSPLPCHGSALPNELMPRMKGNLIVTFYWDCFQGAMKGHVPRPRKSVKWTEFICDIALRPATGGSHSTKWANAPRRVLDDIPIITEIHPYEQGWIIYCCYAPTRGTGFVL